MEEKRIIELLEFISENNRIFVNEKDLIKKFKREEIDFCHQCGLIIRDNLHPHYLLTNNGINFLMGYYMSENTKKLNQSIEDFSKKSKESSDNLNKTIKDFSDESGKYNKKMAFDTWVLIAFTILLFILSGYLAIYSATIRYNDKTQEMSKLTTEINSLDLELQKILEGINELEMRKEIFEEDKTPFQLPLENLRENSFNPDIRNEEIKNRIMILYNRILQINALIELGNSGVYSYFNETKEIINNLRTLFPSYKNCIIKERDFDKC